MASGPVPNTGMIAESLGQDALTTRKHVKVLPTLQLKSHPSIFTIGDIIDWEEQKQGVKANGHTSVIVPNVLSLLGSSKPQKQYQSGPEMILLTNGRVSFDCFHLRGARDSPWTQNSGAMFLGVLWGLTFGNSGTFCWYESAVHPLLSFARPLRCRRKCTNGNA